MSVDFTGFFSTYAEMICAVNVISSVLPSSFIVLRPKKLFHSACYMVSKTQKYVKHCTVMLIFFR